MKWWTLFISVEGNMCPSGIICDLHLKQNLQLQFILTPRNILSITTIRTIFSVHTSAFIGFTTTFRTHNSLPVLSNNQSSFGEVIMIILYIFLQEK